MGRININNLIWHSSTEFQSLQKTVSTKLTENLLRKVTRHGLISILSSKNSERSFIESTETRFNLKCNALGAVKTGKR